MTLFQQIPVGARQAVYAVFTLAGIVLGVLNILKGAGYVESFDSDVAGQILAYLGAGLGVVALGNTGSDEPAKHYNNENGYATNNWMLSTLGLILVVLGLVFLFVHVVSLTIAIVMVVVGLLLIVLAGRGAH